MRVHVALPAQTLVASGSGTIDLRLLPKMYAGRIAHLVKIVLGITYIPTTTALPTVIGDNNFFTRFDLTDGTLARFVGGLNHMRAFEKYSVGRVRIPDADNGASAVARYFRRTLHLGPPQLAGSEGSDFAIPCALLDTASISYNMGALTDFASDCTVVTGSCTVTAVLELLDEVRIPPAVQTNFYNATGADYTLPGRCKYVGIAALNSASFDAITAGDFANYSLDFGFGPIISGVDAKSLGASYADDMAAGEVGTFGGEPGAAADDNGKIVNRASPTAVAAQAQDLQPILWAKPGQKITKLPTADGAVRVSWSGSQTTAVLLVQRLLEQPQNVVIQQMARALNSLALKPKPGTTPQPKTLSKKPYAGPEVAYMPWKISV